MMSPGAARSPSVSIRNSMCQPWSGVLRDWPLAAGEPGRLCPEATEQRGTVDAREFLVERARGLDLQAGNDPLEPRVVGLREIHRVAARRERCVLELLEVLPHVVHDGVDEIRGRPPAGRDRRTSVVVEVEV
jgi:hypothetical protein